MPISSFDATQYRLRDRITVGDGGSAKEGPIDRSASRKEEWGRGRLNPKPIGLRVFGFSRTLLCSLLHVRDSLKRKEGRGGGRR